MKLNNPGYEAYLKHRYDVAADLFYQAILSNKQNAYAHHNYACMLALNYWRSDIKIIIYHLKKEVALDPKRIERILTDPDLDSIRNTNAFHSFIQELKKNNNLHS